MTGKCLDAPKTLNILNFPAMCRALLEPSVRVYIDFLADVSFSWGSISVVASATEMGWRVGSLPHFSFLPELFANNANNFVEKCKRSCFGHGVFCKMLLRRTEMNVAKLYFSYSAMNAGKSTLLLQASYNYQERGMETLLLISSIENRTKQGDISSRIGLSQTADIFTNEDDIFEFIRTRVDGREVACIFIDEAQWMTDEQIWQLAKVVDDLNIPIMCYGLRTDFQGKTFPGSAGLLAIADELREVRTICWCGSKATMVVRLDGEGRPVEEGDQIFVGGNDSYVSLCRKHWRRRELGTIAK